jgi:predicted PurR-regulated permease PerM
MSNRSIRKSSIVRLPAKSSFELFLVRGAQVAMMFVGVLALIFMLHAGEFILAPISLAIVIGLMLGPIATQLENHGVPAGVSAAFAVLVFVAVLCGLAFALASPLSLWSDRIPHIWEQLQAQLSQWRQPLDALRGAREELRGLMGGADLSVTVEDGSAVESMASFAPALIGQILLFFASLYFFVATRHQTRTAILTLCFDRRLRWRVAHIFRDVERLVSRYLISITLINIGEGLAVGLSLHAIGVTSAALWGTLAMLANYIVYIGPAVMTAILFAVGLTEFETLGGSLLPPAIYLAINAVEAQFVTPFVIGRTMTLNPFVVLLALAFWIWLWGALGGFIAIPALLIILAVARNVVPGFDWMSENGARAP